MRAARARPRRATFNKDVKEGALQPSGIIGSIIGAVIALLVYGATTRGHRRHGLFH